MGSVGACGRPARCERDPRRPVPLIEHDVGERDRQIADGRSVDDIAVIEDRGDPLFRWRPTDQNVVVIRVVVDDAETQIAPVDLFPFRKEPFDQTTAIIR